MRAAAAAKRTSACPPPEAPPGIDSGEEKGAVTGFTVAELVTGFTVAELALAAVLLCFSLHSSTLHRGGGGRDGVTKDRGMRGVGPGAWDCLLATQRLVLSCLGVERMRGKKIVLRPLLFLVFRYTYVWYGIHI